MVACALIRALPCAPGHMMGAMGQPSCIGAGIEFKNIFLLMKLLSVTLKPLYATLKSISVTPKLISVTLKSISVTLKSISVTP